MLINCLVLCFVLLNFLTGMSYDSLLKLLEENLPMDSAYKSKDVNAAPIRVIQLIYNAGVSVRNFWILDVYDF